MRITTTLLYLIALILLGTACSKKKRLEGTWYYEYSLFNPYINDSIKMMSYYENNGTAERYQLYQTDNSWTFLKYTVKDVNYKNVHFISKEKYVSILPDSVKKRSQLKSNLVFTRVSKDIKPHAILLGLYNNFFQEMNPMKLDTIFDGTVYCSLVIEERGEETTASMGNKIKYFFDKEMNSLPLREETFIYDKVKRKVYDHYIWENLEARAEIRIYPFDEENITIGESKNKLELQCWLNIK